MLRLNFNKLYYFYVVANEGSIKAASEKLNLAQPTISVQIKSLEEEIGFEVFIRHHKNLILSLKGQILLGRAHVLFTLADELIEDLPKMGNMQKDNFSIGTLHTLASSFISDFSLDLWNDDFVTTTITQAHQSELIEGLKKAQFDFILSDESYNDCSRYTSVNLGQDKVVAFASPLFLESDLKFPFCLNKQPYLSFLSDGQLKTQINHFFTRNSILPVTIGKIDDVSLMKRITEKGLCFSILPFREVEDDVISGKFKQLGEFSDIFFNLWGIFPSMSANHKIVKKVINDYFKPLFPQA